MQVPVMAQATGLPPLLVLGSRPARSSFRRIRWPFMVKSKRPLAGSSPASSRMMASVLRSMPPAKVGLPEVMTMPFTASSVSAASMSPSTSEKASRLSTFMDLPGTSQVITAMPSASICIVKSVMSWSSRGSRAMLEGRGTARIRRPERPWSTAHWPPKCRASVRLSAPGSCDCAPGRTAFRRPASA